MGRESAWRQLEKLKLSEQPSGTFGDADFHSLEEFEHAGLETPKNCVSDFFTASFPSVTAKLT